MSEEQIENLYNKILLYYGPSPYKKGVSPKLVIYNDKDCDCYGWCEWDRIGINMAHCKTTVDIVGTLIHEIWHLHQSPTWYTRHYENYDEYTHPYEIECDNVVKKDMHIFLGEL
jgi:thymidine kinase